MEKVIAYCFYPRILNINLFMFVFSTRMQTLWEQKCCYISFVLLTFSGTRVNVQQIFIKYITLGIWPNFDKYDRHFIIHNNLF